MNKIRPNTYDAILEAGFDTFSQKPGASLDQVAKRAGVGRATLHRHFSSREDLMVALALKAMDELNQAVNEATKDAQSYSEGLRLALTAIVPLSNRQWFLAHEPVENNPEIAKAYLKEQQELIQDIQAAKREGTFANNVPDQWIAQSFENLIYTAWAMVRSGEATNKQAADLAWRTLTVGLKGDDK